MVTPSRGSRNWTRVLIINVKSHQHDGVTRPECMILTEGETGLGDGCSGIMGEIRWETEERIRHKDWDRTVLERSMEKLVSKASSGSNYGREKQDIEEIRAGISKLSVKGQTVNILGFAGSL